MKSMPGIIDGSHTIQAILSYGPVLYGDPDTGTLITINLFSAHWVWWTRVGTTNHWTPEVTMPAESAIMKIAEELAESGRNWHQTQLG